MIKLTKKQFKEFKFVGNLRTQMSRKKGKFISPDVWNYGKVTNAGDPNSVNGEYGTLIYIPFETIEDLGIEVDDAGN